MRAEWAKAIAAKVNLEKSDTLQSIFKAIREEAEKGQLKMELSFQPEAVSSMDNIMQVLSSYEYKVTKAETTLVVDWS